MVNKQLVLEEECEVEEEIEVISPYGDCRICGEPLSKKDYDHVCIGCLYG